MSGVQSPAKQRREDPVLRAEVITFATVGAIVGAAAALGVRAPTRPRLLAGFGFLLLYSLAFTSPSGSGAAVSPGSGDNSNFPE